MRGAVDVIELQLRNELRKRINAGYVASCGTDRRGHGQGPCPRAQQYNQGSTRLGRLAVAQEGRQSFELSGNVVSISFSTYIYLLTQHHRRSLLGRIASEAVALHAGTCFE